MGLWLNVGYLRLAFDDALKSTARAGTTETAMFVALAALTASRDDEARWHAELAKELGFPPLFGHMPVIASLPAQRVESASGAAASSAQITEEPHTGSYDALLQKWQITRSVTRGSIDEAYGEVTRLLDGGRATGEIGSDWVDVVVAGDASLPPRPSLS